MPVGHHQWRGRAQGTLHAWGERPFTHVAHWHGQHAVQVSERPEKRRAFSAQCKGGAGVIGEVHAVTDLCGGLRCRAKTARVSAQSMGPLASTTLLQASLPSAPQPIGRLLVLLNACRTVPRCISFMSWHPSGAGRAALLQCNASAPFAASRRRLHRAARLRLISSLRLPALRMGSPATLGHPATAWPPPPPPRPPRRPRRLRPARRCRCLLRPPPGPGTACARRRTRAGSSAWRTCTRAATG